ncbi:MAG: hypothetical protein MJ080_03005, partial [Clostridia bacterium]|nr:hypothetical protein [Clostridia bacterium]
MDNKPINTRSNKMSTNKMLAFVISLTFLYIFLKSYRASYNSLDTTTQGGIWNIINAALTGLGFLCLFGILGKRRKLPNPIKFYVAYFIWAWFMAIISGFEFSISNVFAFLMIGYVPLATIAIYTFADKGVFETNRRLIIFGYYAVSVFSLFLMIRHSQGEKAIFAIIAYYPICLLPLIMYVQKSRWLFVSIALSVLS